MAQIKTNTAEWFKAAAIRAIKTAAQTALGLITVGAAVSDIDWVQVASVSAVAAIYSLLTSVAGLPEVGATDTNPLAEILYTEEGQPVDSYTYTDENGNSWAAEKIKDLDKDEETEG